MGAPVTKAITPEDTGYGVYDLYDLGEFDQKGSVRTKYGTKQELVDAIAECQKNGVAVYVDLVMNHKAGADEKEFLKLLKWTLTTGRRKYPNRSRSKAGPNLCFRVVATSTPPSSGHPSTLTVRTLMPRQSAAAYSAGENKNWSENVDDEFGNYDYLMFANIDYNHPEVRKEMLQWGKWLIDTLQCSGFRLDAIKHINHEFIKEFAAEMIRKRGRTSTS